MSKNLVEAPTDKMWSNMGVGQGCVGCPLNKLPNKTKKMNPSGRGEKKILIVAEAPGRTEDEKGCPLVGSAGQLLRTCLRMENINLDRDCWATNVIQCRPAGNAWPGSIVADHCRPRLLKQIEEYKPQLIMAFGKHAVEAILQPPFGFSISQMRGYLVPSHEHNCWVSCHFHPSYIKRICEDDDGNEKFPEIRDVFQRDLRKAVQALDNGFPEMPKLGLLYPLISKDPWKTFHGLHPQHVVWDYEATSLSPFNSEAELVCVGLAGKKGEVCIPVKGSKDLQSFMCTILQKWEFKHYFKIAHNINFERLWSEQALDIDVTPQTWCTMNVAHILDERPKTTSLDFQTFCLTGESHKGMIDRAKITEADAQQLYKYNMLDARATYMLFEHQQEELKKPENKNLQKAVDFVHSALPVLSHMESRGVRVDIEEARRQQKDQEHQQKEATKRLLNKQPIIEWEMSKAKRFNPGSDDQLRFILSKIPGLDKSLIPTTPTGKMKVDIIALEAIKSSTDDKMWHEIVDLILQYRKCDKVLRTYLKPILEATNGRLHPTFSMNTTETYRSSSEKPNFQNQPTRDDAQAAIRKCFIPSTDPPYGEILECDVTGAELRVIAMLSRDKKLLRQIQSGIDIHRLWASILYEIPEERVTKNQRFYAKQFFVFAIIYGSYYKSAARSLNLDPTHVQRVERQFWKGYRGIKEWQIATEDFYWKHGYVEMPFGFRRHAPLDRKKIINTPVQGTSFHLVLEGIVEADRALQQAGMKTKIIFEIHDSVGLDAVRSERRRVLLLVNDSIARPKHDWQILPMEVEWKAGPNWYEMETIKGD